MIKQLIILISIVSFGFSNLFISETAEGSSNNKYLEFYNAGSEIIDLSGYAYPNANNGSDGTYNYWNAFAEGATVAPGDVYVVCHGSSDDFILAECDEFHTYLSNGDDGYCLVQGGTFIDNDFDGNIDAGEMTNYTVLDCVGDFYDDPGSGWEVCGVSNATKDHTMVRKSSVTTGNAGEWAASAGTTADDCEWIVLDQNDWSNLGSHTMDSSAMTYTVEAGGFYYAPVTLTIDMGDTVVWENVSGFHDVVSYDGLFSLDACSGPCTIGEITFNDPGEFDYFCSVGNHEQQGMVGTIIVLGEIQLDCTDEAACNFAEPGDCVYPEENFDCDGNCTVEIDDCGECGGDGSSCATINVTASVDMSTSTIGEGGMTARISTINGNYSPSDWYAMSDNGDGTFSHTFEMLPGNTYGYNFNNSDGSGYESGAFIDDVCADGLYGNDRIIEILSDATDDINIPTVCWESCDSCGDVVIPGCTDPDALNYDPNATEDDGSCFYEWPEMDNLFFSEYAEGSSNNKYLEIFNADDNVVDLSTYSLSRCSNGCDVAGEWDYANSVTFEPGDAILEPGNIYVVCHPSSDQYILDRCNQTFTYMSNGDDVFALTQISSGLTLDVIGVVGDDPGTGWDVADVENATQDHTLVRKSSITSGNPLWLDNPDTGEQGSAGNDAEDSEWIVLDQDDWTYLGFHDMDGGSIPECAQDCPDIDLVDGSCDNFGGDDESPECMNNACEIIINWGNCFDDCDAETLCEGPFELMVPACEYCLIDGSCDDLDSALCEVGLDSYIDDCVEDGYIPDDWVGVCEEECGTAGDVNGDDIINVLDVVQIVSAITSSTTDDLDCADMNGDDLINVLDIVQIVGIITGGRAFNANSASLEVNDFDVILKANGYIGGVQMKLEHGSNFELNLNDNCMVADYVNHGDYSILVIVEPKDEILFTTNSKFEIVDILIANSNEEIQLNMVNDFSLSDAYPNPFNPSTSFNINIPSSGYLSVKVFNISGQLVDVIASGVYSPNSYNFTWNANKMATGMYVINAEFEGKNISHNVSLIK